MFRRLAPSAAILFGFLLATQACSGLIGDTSDRPISGGESPGDDSKTPPAELPVSSLEALAEKCSADAAPGASWDGIRRLSSAELIATFTDLVGADAMALVPSYVALLPDDTLFTYADLPSATYTSSHAEAILRLVAQLGERVAATEKLRVRIYGSCAKNTASVTDDCISKAVTAWGKRAYRRPLTTDEVTELMRGYKAASSEDRLALLTMRLLASPSLLFHNERGLDDTASRTRLTAYEVASRLSYQTTGTMPDDALFAAAESGELESLDGVRSQVFRLLQTPRGRARVRDFTRYWLKLDDTPQPSQQSAQRGKFDAGKLRAAAIEEVYDFVENVSFEHGATLDDLFLAQQAYAVDATLAGLYGSTVWDGKSTAPESPTHKGLLNRVAYLLAQADNTSPIMRAVHFRERVMCAFVDPPDFSIIGTRAEQLGEISLTTHSTREAVTELTSTSQCFGCHQSINPSGFVFESFGALGEHRTEEVVYDQSDINKVLARHDIDTRVSDLALGGEPVAASTMDELLTFITESTSPDACIAQHVNGYFATRSISAGDWCGAESVAKSLADGSSFVDAVASAVAKEDIFWRGAQ